MSKKMLIDATHHEEVRIAVVDGNRLEDFDSESTLKPPIKGNIYLAKVIRVEPALQAAFVDFGGGRHGFLPFSEIHPDYYYIPVGDRAPTAEDDSEDAPLLAFSDTDFNEEQDPVGGASLIDPTILLSDASTAQADIVLDDAALDDEDEVTIKRPRFYRYKIQEVIKRRQILLIQVLKEERGNKGASLTTYLSLPGRYCVLMPNAGQRSGGVSRKITEIEDRKRLKEALSDMDLPQGMSVIVRTAGQERNKQELKRDFEYLLRLWGDIRDLTLKSIAPTLVYAEGDIIKRAIRDCYSKDIGTILVEGDEAYKSAKSFLKMLMPSHAKRVQQYKEEDISLFQKFQVEHQVDRMLDPVSPLPSGGSIVINHTEALVAIDVNSGKSTRERHIDETALKTNLEAADEVARQMRLRDLGGLVVVDFIDMSDSKHIHAVEKRLKEAVKGDRARIQLGKISQFGLLELSRQRIRPSIFETNTMACPHCKGTGNVRSHESMALYVLRGIETAAVSYKDATFTAFVPPSVDLHILNHQRALILALESRYGIRIMIQRRDDLHASEYQLEITSGNTTFTPPVKVMELPFKDERRARHAPSKEREVSASQEFESALDAELGGGEDERAGGAKRRRGHFTQRRRGGGSGGNAGETYKPRESIRQEDVPLLHIEEQKTPKIAADEAPLSLEIAAQDGDKKGRRRRRRRRGGQRGEGIGGGSLTSSPNTDLPNEPLLSGTVLSDLGGASFEPTAQLKPQEKAPEKPAQKSGEPAEKKSGRRRSRAKTPVAETPAPQLQSTIEAPAKTDDSAQKKPSRRRRARPIDGENKGAEKSSSGKTERAPGGGSGGSSGSTPPLQPSVAAVREPVHPAAASSGENPPSAAPQEGTQKKRKGWLKRIFEGES